MKIENYIDHTILKSSVSITEIENLCNEAIKYNFKAVCVPPFYIKVAKQILLGTDVLVATVIGFPFGYSDTASKLAEINKAIKDGADELDFVHNIAALKNGDFDYLSKEIAICLQPIRLANKVIKVIIESGILTHSEIEFSCKLYSKHKVDFVKTSTGYAERGATIDAVKVMRQSLPDSIKIKASGGIKTFENAKEFINLGVDRIGTSSGIQIFKEAQLL